MYFILYLIIIEIIIIIISVPCSNFLLFLVASMGGHQAKVRALQVILPQFVPQVARCLGCLCPTHSGVNGSVWLLWASRTGTRTPSVLPPGSTSYIVQPLHLDSKLWWLQVPSEAPCSLTGEVL